MIKKYAILGMQTYGSQCEFGGCGWKEATCDVHHINYQEQQDIEKRIRSSVKESNVELTNQLILEANQKGFLFFDYESMDLEKDHRSINLAILCPNHHRYVHHIDMGMDILKKIPPRK